MSRAPLSGSAYTGRSTIANAQKTINWIAEYNDDQQAPTPFTYYQTPGLDLIATPNTPGKVRGEYRTSIGTGYIVIGPTVYFIATNNALVFVGNIADRQSQVYMVDNGLAVVIVDGSSTGYAIDINTNAFGPIVDHSFYGADFVAFLQTFFCFNKPATNQFYISLSNVSFAMLIGTAIGTGSISAAGSLYTDGTYQNVPLTGGTGTGATANIIVTGGAVTGVTIDSPGEGYLVGDILSANASDIGGTGGSFTWTVDTFALAFDPLDIAAKSGFSDPIVGIVAIHAELWLIGALTTEVWIGTGSADFFFQQVQGAFIEHGSIAQYSIAKQDVLVFFLMQDQQGKNIVVEGQGYDVDEISTPYLVDQFNSYTTTNDAIGFCFQQEDHSYYCIIFPTANKTWLYDLKTKKWSEWAWLNTDDGSLNRHRANCAMFWNEMNVVGDWENGNIYALNFQTYTDNGTPIVRIKTFFHMMADNDRVIYNSFDADMEVATQPPGADDEPLVYLSWSDDRGATYGFPVAQSMGRSGETLTTISWNRLGMARDRVFKLQTSEPIKLALNGGFVVPKKAKT